MPKNSLINTGKFSPPDFSIMRALGSESGPDGARVFVFAAVLHSFYTILTDFAENAMK
jgi:hypothetical protein